jgi:unspecific monooxygenase
MLQYSSAVYSDFTTAFVFGLQSASNFVQDKKSRSRWLANKKFMTEITYWMMAFPPSVSSFLTKLGINLENQQINSAMEEINDMYLNMLRTTETLSDSSRMSRAENKNEKWTEPVVYKQLLNQLQSSNEKPPTNPLPESHLRLTVASELMDHLVAGTETTGWTLAYLMDELSQRPTLQSSLRGELLSLSPPILYPVRATNNGGSTARDALPSPRAIDALQLLDAILLETLRLHAPVGGSQPRTTPSSNPQSPTVLLGYRNIPPGIRVSAQAYCLHRNPEIFPDPEMWKPERWLEASEEERSEMLRWFWAFGSGANMCLGNHLATLGECLSLFTPLIRHRFPRGINLHDWEPELKFVVAAIYTNYTTKIVEDEDMEQLDGYVTGPKGEKLILQFERAG